jgi:hypothetical protein
VEPLTGSSPVLEPVSAQVSYSSVSVGSPLVSDDSDLDIPDFLK